MFRVRWTRNASNQLADIWTAAADQAAVTAASHRVEQALARDPENQGEDRPNNRRIVFEPPLVMTYRINKADGTVTVLNVSRYGTAS
jgi:plasmid stabilization system protein ParE